jgi:hypothetical protein
MTRGRIKFFGNRVSTFLRNSVDSDLAREAGDQIKSFATAKPLLSACFGLAAGFALGMLFRRRN